MTLIQYVNTVVSVKLSMYNLGNKATSVTCTPNLLLLGKRKTLMIKIIYVKKKKHQSQTSMIPSHTLTQYQQAVTLAQWEVLKILKGTGEALKTHAHTPMQQDTDVKHTGTISASGEYHSSMTSWMEVSCSHRFPNNTGWRRSCTQNWDTRHLFGPVPSGGKLVNLGNFCKPL